MRGRHGCCTRRAATPDRVAAQVLAAARRRTTRGPFERLASPAAPARVLPGRGGRRSRPISRRALDEPAPAGAARRRAARARPRRSRVPVSIPLTAVGHLPARRWTVKITIEQALRGPTMRLAGVLRPDRVRVPEAVDPCWRRSSRRSRCDQDLRGSTEAALANITRIDPLTPPPGGRGDRGDARAGRIRFRAGSGGSPATIAAEMGMARRSVLRRWRTSPSARSPAWPRARPRPPAGRGSTPLAGWSPG